MVPIVTDSDQHFPADALTPLYVRSSLTSVDKEQRRIVKKLLLMTGVVSLLFGVGVMASSDDATVLAAPLKGLDLSVSKPSFDARTNVYTVTARWNYSGPIWFTFPYDTDHQEAIAISLDREATILSATTSWSKGSTDCGAGGTTVALDDATSRGAYLKITGHQKDCSFWNYDLGYSAKHRHDEAEIPAQGLDEVPERHPGVRQAREHHELPWHQRCERRAVLDRHPMGEDDRWLREERLFDGVNLLIGCCG